MNQIKLSKLISYLLLLSVILMIVSGYGITKPRIINEWTFGLLNKRGAFSLHSFLVVPLLILLILHAFPLYKIKSIVKRFKNKK